MIIGVTGKSGSGKNHFVNTLMTIGISGYPIHADMDIFAWESIMDEPTRSIICEQFGITDPKVDQRTLADLVFNDQKRYDQLMKLVYGGVCKRVDEIVNKNKSGKVIILNHILLPTTRYWKMCQIKFLVETPYGIREERAMARDKISREDFAAREANSIDYKDYEFDHIIKGG